MLKTSIKNMQVEKRSELLRKGKKAADAGKVMKVAMEKMAGQAQGREVTDP